ncbi:MAG: dihydrodipicolinate synthase family protein [Planctomycetota bacterium]|nr:dihydrodipicolinate synthase family protein [Planctomycetota bacterium]
MPRAQDLKRIRAALSGPIASVRTPFNRNGSIDYAGVGRMLEFTFRAGGKVCLLTAGDSHFTCMSDEEIARLNRYCIERTRGWALTVACDWEFATPQALAFARRCASWGADLLMARPPDWAASASVEGLVAHYAALGKIMPLMLVTNIFHGRPERFSFATIEALLRRVPRMLAVKDDLGGDFARKLCLASHARWAVFSGGGLRNHLNLHPYGCDGFMDRHMNFAPQVSFQYWDAARRGDLPAARKVIREIELPLEEFMGGFPGGRDAAIHGLLEIYGIAGRWRRKPYHSLSGPELAKLKSFVKGMGLL